MAEVTEWQAPHDVTKPRRVLMQQWADFLDGVS
jgi:hypothetical protein